MSRQGVSGFRPRFFVPAVSGRSAAVGAFISGDLTGAEFVLSSEDSHHARAVLRLQPGDACEVVVGAPPEDVVAPGAAMPGGPTSGAATSGAAVYAATVSSVGDRVVVRLQGRLSEELAGAAYRFEVGLVQAMARPAVMDYVFEKGTEVGASFFMLVASAGSPSWAAASANDRLDRWSRIVREAAKQSKQVAVPRVVFAGSPQQAVDQTAVLGARSFVLDPGASLTLEAALSDPGGRWPGAIAGPIALWVGPESGWTEGETKLFERAGFTSARLGRSVLRTETAGAVAVAVARLALGDW